jgi:hypothetical protein
MTLPDRPDSYIILTFKGPFGTMWHTSPLMRLSEASFTAASLAQARPHSADQLVTLIKVEIVQLRYERS